MSAAPITIPRPSADGYTTADLHALPDDGRRWELIDGSLILSPSATINHNNIARWIAQILEESCPDDGLGSAPINPPPSTTTMNRGRTSS